MLSRKIAFVILSLVILIVLILVQLLVYISNPSVLQKLGVTNVILVVVGLLSIILSLIVSVSPFLPTKKELEAESKYIGARINVSDIASNPLEDLNKEQQEQEQKLLNVKKQELELDRERFALEQERQVIRWQKEALSLVNISPRAAILIAWIGVEQELERVATRLNLFETKNGKNNLSLFVIDRLLRSEYIHEDYVSAFRRMRSIRNRVMQGQEEKELTSGQAIDFIQDAIDLTEKLSSLEKKELPIEESII